MPPRLPLALVLALSLPGMALAGDLSLDGGVTLSFAGGDGNPGTYADVYLSAEKDFGDFYLLGSVDLSSSQIDDEIDLSFGWSHETENGVGFDLSYTRTAYPYDGGDCCGEVDVIVTLPVGKAATATLGATYYPEDHSSDAHLEFDYSPDDRWTLTADIGHVGYVGEPDGKEWELAAAYDIGDRTSAVLHYYDGNDFAPYFEIDLTWSFALSKAQGE